MARPIRLTDPGIPSAARRKPLYPALIERRYRTLLVRRVRATARLVEAGLAELADLTGESRVKVTRIRADSLVGIVALQRILSTVSAGLPPAPSLGGLAAQLDLFTQRQVAETVSALIPLDHLTRSDNRELLSQWARANAALIESIDSRYLSDVSEAVAAALAEGRSVSSLGQEIASLTGRSERRATLIARDQVGSLNGQITRLRQTELGIERYVWISSRDERVRPEHEERDGEEFRWDSPPPDGHPGEPINCRCTAIAIVRG